MWVADLEADALLDEITKLWCFVSKKYKKDQFVVFTYLDKLPKTFMKEQEDLYNIEWHDLSELTEWLEDDCDILCIHNLFGYDLEALKVTGYIDQYDIYPETINNKPKRLIDTLSMSRALYPDRPLPKGCPAKIYNPVTGRMDTVGSHGLAAWGYRVSNAKPQVHDWRDQPLEVYVHRCIEDVVINDLTLQKLVDESTKLARGDTVPKIGFKSEWKSALRINNKSDFLMCKQEQDGILLDIDAAIKLRDYIDDEMDRIAEEVEKDLPLRELPKSARADFPATPFKQDGSISSHGWNWLKRLGYDVNEEAFNQIKIPAKPFKADGTLSATGRRFCEEQEFTGTDDELKSQINALRSSQEAVKPLSCVDLRKATRDLKNRVEPDWRVPMKISNQDDIKLYLVQELNWYPTLWNTKDVTRDQNKRALTEAEQDIKIEAYIEKCLESPYRKFIEEEMELDFGWSSKKLWRQLRRKARFLVTTPKLKDERGELCPSLEYLKADMAKKIVKWLSLRNRRSVIQSKDEKKNTGWLNNPRLQVDGRIGQGFSGVTNTNRYKHRVIVNLPKASPDVLLGKEMRSLFIAPEDHYIIGYDGSNLEQFVGGSYAWIFDQGTYLEELKGDAHQRNADAYTIAAGRDVSRDDGKGVTYACLPVDSTDVLTKEGWKSYDQLSKNDLVLTHDDSLGCYVWNEIEKIHYYKDQQLAMLSNSHIGFESTYDHRWKVYKRRQKGHRGERYLDNTYVETKDITTECSLHNNSYYDQGFVTEDQANLVAWLLSDGYYKWSDKSDKTSSSFGNKKGIDARIIQSDNKFQKKVEDCLKKNNIGYSITKDLRENGNHVNYYLLNSGQIRDFLDDVVGCRKQKHDVDWCKWLLSLNQQSLVSFLNTFWLADGHTKRQDSWTITQNKGNIADALILCGNLTGKVVTYNNKSDKCLNINFRESNTISGQRLTKTKTRTSDVFCLTVPNSNFVIRQNGYITITGNCMYGAQAPKIAAMLGVDRDTGQAVINAFWDTNLGLKKFKNALEKYWENTGKKYIRGIDGRKIYTRSKHSLVNAAFQSCGATLMSVSGCYMYNLLVDAGFELGDKVIRLAYVHDEYQYQVHKSLVDVYEFDTEEECKEFSIKGKLLSNPKQKGDKWYRYYSIVGELGNKSLTKAGEYLKMPVTFTAAYDVGKNLAETH